MTDLSADYVAPVMAFGDWPSNAEMIEDCARLGYLKKTDYVLDATYGQGTFWKRWSPDQLLANDLYATPKAKIGNVVGFRRFDFTAFPDSWERSFDCVVFDPPYKLNGTPDQAIDQRYGVHLPTRWQDRMALVRAGITECARVLGDGYFLLKCQDQVCSGKVRWQTDEFTEHARRYGLGKVDRLDFPSYRPQPTGRTQVHARRNTSSLLVFKRGWETSDLPRLIDGQECGHDV